MTRDFWALASMTARRRGDDALSSISTQRKRRGNAAGGDDDAFGFERLRARRRSASPRRGFAGDGAETFDVVDLCLRIRRLDAFGQASTASSFCFHICGRSSERPVTFTPMLGRVSPPFVIFARSGKSAFEGCSRTLSMCRRLAAAFDDRGLQAKLAGADGAIEPPGRPDNDEIVRHRSVGDSGARSARTLTCANIEPRARRSIGDSTRPALRVCGAKWSTRSRARRERQRGPAEGVANAGVEGGPGPAEGMDYVVRWFAARLALRVRRP